MRTKTYVLCFALAVAGFGSGYGIGMHFAGEPAVLPMAAAEYEIPQNVPSPSPVTRPPAPSPIAKKQYLLMLSGESIHLYELLENGGTELLQEMAVDTRQMRQEDYEKLCRGITVNNLEEARGLCEDFGG